jgi:hypothetical protein
MTSASSEICVAQVSLQANAPSSRRKLLRTSNLAVNARDAKPQGGPIVIAARPETVALAHGRLQPGKYVCLSLTDTGEGMDEDTLARPIDPFFTTKETGKGTGLGLPMVHGLAEHSGGQLILRSQKGRGTTAELWLPVAKKTEEATEAKAPAQVPAKGGGWIRTSGYRGRRPASGRSLRAQRVETDAAKREFGSDSCLFAPP